jgi:serine/threonine-protein kinase
VRGGSDAGELLLARDRELGRDLAVKRIPTAALRHPEAAAAGGTLDSVRRFTHPGVAEVLDHVDAPGGVLLAREWVGGTPLPEVHDLPLPAALGLARQLAAALAAVHDAGLVHGRVKPENLVLVPGLGARLTGLGVGLLAGSGPSRAAGDRLLAPEQRDGSLGDAAADVYAFGALVARLASGRWWSGEGAEEGAAAPGTELPPELAALLRRCLAADPAARPADAGVVLDTLSGISI